LKVKARDCPWLFRAWIRKILSAPTAGSLPMFWLFTFTIPFPDSSIRTCEVTSAHRFPAPHSAFITCQPGPGKTPPYCPHAGTAESRTITANDPIRKNTDRFLIGFSFRKDHF
jgi:hypothetical protein